MIADLVLRFLVGGALVAVFAVLGDMFAPKSFASLFVAAPSVVLATMIRTGDANGVAFASIEAARLNGSIDEAICPHVLDFGEGGASMIATGPAVLGDRALAVAVPGRARRPLKSGGAAR